MLEKTPYKFNIRISAPDSRDFTYKQEETTVREIVDLREYDSPVEDQGRIGACAAHAVTSTYENLVKQKYPNMFTELSRLYQYYHTRYMEHSVGQDYGVIHLRNSMKSLKKYCICAEEFWPYNIYKYEIQPLPNSYADATKRTLMDYASLNNNNDTLSALNENYPVVVGMEVFNGFMNLTSSSPIVEMPGPMDISLGGHSLCLVGYSIPDKKFLAKNSFGKDWGDNGYCWIPFEYADTYMFDRWIFNINNQQIKYEN